MIKRILVIWLTFTFVISVAACGKNTDTVKFHDVTFDKSDLSEETLEWLEWYNSLPAEKQLAVSSIPDELYTFDGTGDVEEAGPEE